MNTSRTRDASVPPSKTAAAVAVAVFVSLCSAAACDVAGQQEVRWSVSPTPDVQIGVVDGPDAYLFDAIAAGRFLPDGRMAVAEAVGGNPEVYLDSYSNGDVVLASLRFGERTNAEATPDRWTLGRFTLDGAFREDLGDVRGMRRFDGYPVPFSPMPSVIVRRDSLYVADGYEAELAVRDAGGNPRRTIELAGLAGASPNGVWSSLEEELERRDRELYVDYLEEELVPREDRLPGNVRPLDVRNDRILGVATDAYGVERVVVHAVDLRDGSPQHGE